MQKCIQLVITLMDHPKSDEKKSSAMLYACRYWCYHLASASSLASPSGLESIMSQVQLLESFVCKIEQQWLTQWLYSLNGVYKETHIVNAIRNWLEEIYKQFKVHIFYIILISAMNITKDCACKKTEGLLFGKALVKTMRKLRDIIKVWKYIYKNIKY
jgi:hypothetical protein